MKGPSLAVVLIGSPHDFRSKARFDSTFQPFVYVEIELNSFIPLRKLKNAEIGEDFFGCFIDYSFIAKVAKKGFRKFAQMV